MYSKIFIYHTIDAENDDKSMFVAISDWGQGFQDRFMGGVDIATINSNTNNNNNSNNNNNNNNINNINSNGNKFR